MFEDKVLADFSAFIDTLRVYDNITVENEGILKNYNKRFLESLKVLLKMLFKERFSRLYPNCSLWEISLSFYGFTLFYKTDSGLRYIERLNVGEDRIYEYLDEGGNYETENLARTEQLFEGIGFKAFKQNAVSISYKDMDYWTCPF